jgi:hypothetical protein
MLAMTGRVTMFSARWAGKGGSSRTVQRFFHTALPWATLFWVFFRQHLYRSSEVYLLAGDEVVVTKAGKKTYGLERFFSSLYGKSLTGLSFFTLSLVSVQQKRSFPIRVEQVIKSDREKLSQGSENTESRRPKGQAKRHKASRSKNQTVPTAPEPIPKNQGGRPAGRKNKNKSAVPLNPELLLLQSWIESLLKQLGRMLPLTYLLLDGHFGNNASLQMARRLNLHLISKLRYDSALYIPYQNPDPDRKCRRIYGDKLDISNMPAQYLKNSAIDGPILTDIYQAQLLHKEFAQPLNVVVLVKTHQSTNARHHIILFTSDSDLPYDKVINFYSLRFQIEFNFRDAKQFWGLEDFMNVSQTAVTNAANLSFFMVNLSHHLIGTGPEKHSGDSVLDLKAMCRGSKYVAEIIKLLPEKPEPVLLAQIFQRISRLGRIHRLPACSTLG